MSGYRSGIVVGLGTGKGREEGHLSCARMLAGPLPSSAIGISPVEVPAPAAMDSAVVGTPRTPRWLVAA